MIVTVHDERGAQVGARVRDARRARGLTQRQLAFEAGIGIGTLRDLEQGRVQSPQPDTVTRLERILGLDDERQEGIGGLWIGVLGPLVVFRDGRHVPLRTAGQRAVLGMLALGCGGMVRQDAIVDALWGENPPSSATSILHSYISRLRSVLDLPGSGVLFREARGYRLRVAVDQLDLIAFRHLAAQAPRRPPSATRLRRAAGTGRRSYCGAENRVRISMACTTIRRSPRCRRNGWP